MVAKYGALKQMTREKRALPRGFPSSFCHAASALFTDPPPRKRGSQRGPTRVGLEAKPVPRLLLLHHLEPLFLATGADGLDRAAAVRREAGAEDHPDVHQV